MKKLFFILTATTALLWSCKSSNNGELVGVNDRPYFEDIDLKGMVFINQGNYTMGAGVQNVTYGKTPQPRNMQISSFFMDETEITNNEYRQFVSAVADSIARNILGNVAGRNEYLIMDNKYGQPLDNPMLNYKKKIDYNNADIHQDLADNGFYITDIYHREVIDVSKLNYEYFFIDYSDVSRKENNVSTSNEYRGTSFAVRPKGLGDSRNKQIQREFINIYPDTLCWVHDYAYSWNEDYSRSYFSSPAFDNYPVVGVSWRQARAFCVWRSNMLNNYLEGINYSKVNDFRLPTESEWEYAARGGISGESYPWGGPYVRNPNGCFLANYEPLKGAYDDDGGVRTLMVGHYAPNDFGLYDMAGNVSEWCLDAYNESTYIIANAITPYYNYDAKDDDPLNKKRKVIRGGSWKDQKYFIQVQTRDFEFMDTAKCYIGFRCVQPYLGRVKGDNLRTASNVAR